MPALSRGHVRFDTNGVDANRSARHDQAGPVMAVFAHHRVSVAPKKACMSALMQAF
jgi:hypothetical protein